MIVTSIIHSYWFWMLICGGLCLALERLYPWRKSQQIMRPQLFQDIVFLAINGHFFGLAMAYISAWSIKQTIQLTGLAGLPDPHAAVILRELPFAAQFIIFFVVKDFLEWCIHNLLHKVNILWEFHKLHHSITYMDWIGNFRFHWMEIIIYRSLTWLPLTLLGVDYRVLLPMAVITTIIGNLNHANIKITWGPLLYIINSSSMHIWHHDEICHQKNGQNFAIVFSVWDWIFGTAYLPRKTEQPEKLGFKGIDKFPQQHPLAYMLWPVWRKLTPENKDEIP